jgi:chromosome segregation ATPase
MSQVDLDAGSSGEERVLALKALRTRRQQLVDKMAQVEQRLQACTEAERPKLLDLKAQIVAAIQQQKSKIEALIALGEVKKAEPDPELQKLLHQREQEIARLQSQLSGSQEELEELEEQLAASRQGLSSKIVELRTLKSQLDLANQALAEKKPEPKEPSNYGPEDDHQKRARLAEEHARELEEVIVQRDLELADLQLQLDEEQERLARRESAREELKQSLLSSQHRRLSHSN